VRQLVTDSIMAYLMFFRKFKKARYFTPTDIIEGRVKEWPRMFLQLKLTIDNGKILFGDALD
jgi:hypothetical protein